ncbi:tail fiber protein [Photorhabdus thracensis]|nr:tail fiber protein [Photorhabdus thracensis]
MENIKSNGPSVNDLKRRFKEGSIPLQTDYADLINIADIGRRAVGKAPGQTDNPNSALKLDNDGALAVKLNDNGGLKADENGLNVKIKNKSLLADNSGLAVNAGRGLRINNDKLEVDDHHGIEIVNEGVKVKASNGINVNSDGVSVKAKDKTINVESTGISVRLGWGIKIDDGLDVKASNGINVDSNGVSVKAGDGINVDTNGVSVKTKDKTINVESTGISANLGWGVKVSNGGIDVKPSDGINVGPNGVSVKSKNSTIKVESTGISVGIGWGIKIGDGLDVKASNGINVDGNGVSVKAGDGIKVDNNGVSIDPNKVLPKGMIVMFSGSSAPTGWAFCDGSNGTPDLRSRFVMCGETISETGKSGDKVIGSGNGRYYFRDTTLTEVSVNVTVQNTTLTKSQIPSHKHIGGMSYYNSNGISYSYYQPDIFTRQIYNNSNTIISDSLLSTPRYPYTSETGGGQGHNHQATASSSLHGHRVNLIPPYYLLAFIMKL